MLTEIIELEDLEPLKIEYNKAKEQNQDIFIYKKQEFVTDYAKYLIEYMENIKEMGRN